MTDTQYNNSDEPDMFAFLGIAIQKKERLSIPQNEICKSLACKDLLKSTQNRL